VLALLRSSFRHVLLLDSDSLPLADPSRLFDDPLYQQRGALFWPGVHNPHNAACCCVIVGHTDAQAARLLSCTSQP
jgi:hypothetical protein